VNNSILRLCLCIAFIQLSVLAFGETIFTIQEGFVNKKLEQGVDYKLNNFPHEAIEDVINVPFHHEDQAIADFKHNSDNVYWAQLTIKNESKPGSFAIFLCDPKTGDVTFYKKNNQGIYVSDRAGYDYTAKNRTIQTIFPSFQLDVPMGTTETFYFRVSSKDDYRFDFQISSLPDFINFQTYEYYINGLFIGIVFSVFIVTFFLFLYTRKRVYGYYLVFIVGIVLSVDSTHIYQFLWSSISYNNLYHYYHPIEFIAMTIGYLLYIIAFLKLKEKHKLMYNISIGILISYTVISLIDYYFIGSVVHYVLMVVPFLWALGCTIWDFCSTRKLPVLLLLFGVAFCSLSLCLKIGVDVGVIPNFTSFYLGYIFIWGSILDLIFFMLVLTHSYRVHLFDKIKADKKHIIQLEATKKLVDEQNNRLEHIVDIKTAQLKLEKERVEKLNETLHERILYLQNRLGNTNRTNIIEYSDFINYFPDESFCYDYLLNLKVELKKECSNCNGIGFTVSDEDIDIATCDSCQAVQLITEKTIFEDLDINILHAFYILYLYKVYNGVIPKRFYKEMGIHSNNHETFLNKIQNNISLEQLEQTDDWSKFMLS